MPLDPQAQLVLDNLPADAFDVQNVTGAEMRKMYEEQVQLPFPKEEVAEIRELAIPGPAGEIPARLYVPAGDGPKPPLAYYHGGGWVIGSLETHDATVRKLANASGCAVVSVDYRLAPENPFPAAAEDCFAAACWVAENAARLGAAPGPLAVAGDSAGGNLAAVTALRCRDRGGPELSHQLLIYPVVDCDFERPSYRENAEGYLLSREVMMWFWDQYVPDAARRRDPAVNPLAADTLAGLAPATVITAEYDPLRDEGEAYAAALRHAGVATTLTRYDGMIHGFFSFSDFVDQAKHALAQGGDALRDAFAD